MFKVGTRVRFIEDPKYWGIIEKITDERIVIIRYLNTTSCTLHHNKTTYNMSDSFERIWEKI